MEREVSRLKRGKGMTDRNHFFKKVNEGWVVKCSKEGKEFRPSIFDNNNGLCPFCGEPARMELDKTKLENRRIIKLSSQQNVLSRKLVS